MRRTEYADNGVEAEMNDRPSPAVQYSLCRNAPSPSFFEPKCATVVLSARGWERLITDHVIVRMPARLRSAP